MYRFPLLLVALALCGSSLLAQSLSLPAGYLTTDGNSSSSLPFNTSDDQKWQWHYDNANFAGVTGPIVITEISVRASDPTFTINAFSFPSVTVTLANATTDFPAGAHDPVFANNLAGNATVVRSGSWSGGPVAPSTATFADWIPLGLTTPFVFNPDLGDDLIIQVEKCGSTALFGTPIDVVFGSAAVVGGNRYGDLNSCSSASSTFNNNAAVPVLKIDYNPSLYQVNSTKASLDHNGIVGNGFLPAVTSVLPGQPVTVNFATTLTGFPHEVVVAFGPQVPKGDPAAFELLDGQVFNVPLAGPTTGFLNGGVIPAFVPAFNVSLPFIAPPVALTWSAQTIYFDFTSPSLLTLSAASTMRVQVGTIDIEALGTNSFNLNITAGFFKITNNIAGTSILDVTFDWAASPDPGQATMVFDTDQTSMADVFDGGNSTVTGCQGTYRNGCDVTCGLVYDAANTISTCDPLANTGFIASSPSAVSNSYQTLQFRFNGFDFGKTFEFDVDTDGGNGTTGGAMAGMVVTLTTDNQGVLNGTLVADPNDSTRSFLQL